MNYKDLMMIYNRIYHIENKIEMVKLNCVFIVDEGEFKGMISREQLLQNLRNKKMK
jgi:hypothetical protein